MSAFTRPIVVDAARRSMLLERIPLTATNAELFSERWLQDTLFANPQCLPIQEIDPHIGPLIPVCTELETGAGPADILFVTPTGQLVLIETKLWRNPEARRAVVAQILDYAKQLTEWAYEDLERQTAIASGQGKDYLLSCLRRAQPNIDESVFVDGINRSLKGGDFLLLIVGDGIRSGAESLVGFIEQYGNLRFGLGLIEVAAYRLPNDEVLLQPRILAKTEILQRTVLWGPTGPVKFEDTANAEDRATSTNPQYEWFERFWSEYLSVLRLDDSQQPVPRPGKSTNMFFPMPPNPNAAWISAYIAQSVGSGGVYLTFSKSFEKAGEIYEQFRAQQEDIERNIGQKLTWEKNGNKVYISAPPVPFRDLNGIEDRKRVIAYLADMTNRFVNEFRHRLETLTRDPATRGVLR